MKHAMQLLSQMQSQMFEDFLQVNDNIQLMSLHYLTWKQSPEMENEKKQMLNLHWWWSREMVNFFRMTFHFTQTWWLQEDAEKYKEDARLLCERLEQIGDQSVNINMIADEVSLRSGWLSPECPLFSALRFLATALEKCRIDSAHFQLALNLAATKENDKKYA